MNAALLTLLTLAAAPRSVTNTEAVHALAPLGDRVIACTEGGVDVFSPAGAWQRTLHVEDGLPAHGCRAARAVERSVFLATDLGVVELTATLTLTPVSDVRWQALPEAPTREALLARLAELQRTLPADGTWTAFSAHYAGTADGRIVRVGAPAVRTVPGVVLRLQERAGELRIGTSEGLFILRAFGASGVEGAAAGTTGRPLTPSGVEGRPATTAADRPVTPSGVEGQPATAAADRPVTPSEVERAVSTGPDEAAWLQGSLQLIELDAPPARLGFAGDLVLSRDGRVFRWAGALEPTGAQVAPDASALLELGGATWAGTRADGVHRATRGGDRRVTPAGQLCSNHVTALARAGARTVVGTFDRGVCWEQGGRWVRAHAPALPSDQVLGVAADGERLYVATTNGLGYFDGRAWTQVAFGGRNPIGLARLTVLAVQPAPEGVWVMDGRGASLVARGKALGLLSRTSPPEGWADHPSVVGRAGAFLWYASEDRGLLRFDGQRWTRFHDGRDLTDNWITALDGDASGRLVAGTCQTGFNYFDGQTWARVPGGLPSAMVTAVALTKAGAWVGTLAGVVRYEAATGALTPLPGLADPRVSALLEAEGTLYVGTEGGLTIAPLRSVSQL